MLLLISTARSERRAKEVGIRKVVGSAKSQLVAQFFTESVSLAMFGFILSLIFVNLTLPFFNVLADKKMNLLWTTPAFWILGFGFTLLTGLIAGSYPAFFLSSFKPIEVLKGTFRLRTFSVLPRKMLVVLQFTVSVTLIIGTVIVYEQILFAKNRPVGYSRERLLVVKLTSPEIQNHYEALKNELLGIEAINSVAASQNPTTEVWDNRNGFEWSNLNSNIEANFATMAITHNYGKTIGWQFVKGRDFSNEYATDASSIVLNESASKFMGFENPVGEIVKWGGEDLKVIGVIKDMIMTSPYEPVEPTVFYLNSKDANFINIKIKDDAVLDAALAKAEKTFKKYNAPFDYKFADQEYNLKFSNETRLGQLATFFTMLAIFISCMGIFGVASFIAEQRTKEIGIRKVLGASVFNVWGMLSTEFVFLVLLSCLIAIPVSYYFLSDWLKTFQYHTEISWWVFALSGTGALIVTLATVSFQAVKAAMANPVNSLGRNENLPPNTPPPLLPMVLPSEVARSYRRRFDRSVSISSE